MGVGGGFLMVPVMVYLLGMPIHMAVGTSLFPVLLTCADVAILQSATNHNVDVVLALLLAIGSAVAAQIGARVSRILSGDQLLIILASLALVVAGKMIVETVVPPSSVLAPVRTHGSAHIRTSQRGDEAGPGPGGKCRLPATASRRLPDAAAGDLPFRVEPAVSRWELSTPEARSAWKDWPGPIRRWWWSFAAGKEARIFTERCGWGQFGSAGEG